MRVRTGHLKRVIALCALCVLCGLSNAAPSSPGKVTIRLADVPLRSSTDMTQVAALAVVDEFFRRHPEYGYESITGITLPEGLDEAKMMMAFAGEQGPDVFSISMRQVQNFIRLGLVMPLDGLISKHKAKHPDWKMPDLGLTEGHWDAARDDAGKLYAMLSDYWILSLWYRKDLFEEAGIIPPRPPSDWNEYFEFAQKLTSPQKKVKNSLFQAGQYGTDIRTGFTAGYIFTNFVLQAGGEMTKQERICPVDGTVNDFPKEDKVCACAKCGRSLMDQPRTWKLTYGEEPGQRALAFYKKLRWTEWTRCPGCGTPNNLPVVVCPNCKEPNPIRSSPVFPKPGSPNPGASGATEPGFGKTGLLRCRVCGTEIAVTPEQSVFHCKKCGRDLRSAPIFTGVVRVGGDPTEMFYRGEIAMMLDHLDPGTIDQVLNMGGLRPDQIGFGPPPKAPGGRRAALTGATAWCINMQAARDPRILEAAWRYLLF